MRWSPPAYLKAAPSSQESPCIAFLMGDATTSSFDDPEVPLHPGYIP